MSSFKPENDSERVSVVIPVHNGGEAFQRCLDSLCRSTHSPHEVIVVADGDTDGSRQRAEAWGARVLVHDQPHGPARARNRGAGAAQSDVIFFVDADVEVHPDTIANVATAFACEPTLDALIGSYDDTPGAGNFLSQYRNLLHHHTHQTAREDASTFWGACGAVRREVFQAVGGFDERYHRPCIEDIELGYRMKRADYCIKLYKNVQVRHLKRWSAMSILKTDVLARGMPWTELLLQRGRLDNDLNVDVRSRLSVAVAFMLVGALGAALLYPLFWGGVVLAAVLLVGLNVSFYRFLLRQRGWVFTLKALPWHGFYYLYSGLAFILGAARYGYRSLTSSERLAPPNEVSISPERRH